MGMMPVVGFGNIDTSLSISDGLFYKMTLSINHFSAFMPKSLLKTTKNCVIIIIIIYEKYDID